MEKPLSKILVIKLGALGDFIQALGPMAAIRHNHPDSHITLLTTNSFIGFAEQSGYFDDIWIDARPKWYQIRGWLRLQERFNNAGFDRIYDLQNNDRTSLYFRLLKFSQKPEWVGTAKGASHRNVSSLRTAGSAFEGHVQTLGLVGIDNIEIDDMKWVQADITKFSLPDRYALVVPGCALNRPEKQWPAQCYGEIAQWLVKKNITPVILGTGAEQEQARIISENCSEAINLVSKTSLSEIVVLAHHANLAVGNDTGPMHIIGTTGCKSLVLFSGHSNPKRHAPLGARINVIQEKNLENLSTNIVVKSLEAMGIEKN